MGFSIVSHPAYYSPISAHTIHFGVAGNLPLPPTTWWDGTRRAGCWVTLLRSHPCCCARNRVCRATCGNRGASHWTRLAANIPGKKTVGFGWLPHFNGISLGVYWNSMWYIMRFNGVSMGFNGIQWHLRGFYWDLVVMEWDNRAILGIFHCYV